MITEPPLASCSFFAAIDQLKKIQAPTEEQTSTGARWWVAVSVCRGTWHAGRTVNRTFGADGGECIARRPSLLRLLVLEAHHLSTCALWPTSISLQGCLLKTQIPGPSRLMRAANLHFNSPSSDLGHFKG